MRHSLGNQTRSLLKCLLQHFLLDKALNIEIQSLQTAFVLTNEGELQEYLRTHFKQHPDGMVELQQ